MTCSKSAFNLLIVGLLSIASIAHTRNVGPGFKLVDETAKQINNDFCPSGNCTYLSAEALCDLNNIEREARDSIQSSWLYALGLASKKEITRRAGKKYVKTKACSSALSREGASHLEAETVAEIICMKFEVASHGRGQGKCSRFIGMQLEDMVDNVVADVRAVKLKGEKNNSTVRPTQSTEEIEYSPSYRTNSGCGDCGKYTSENTRVYLPKLEGDINNVNERGNRKEYESCCGAHLCFDCAYLFNNTANRICPCCSKTVDKLLVGELVNNKKGIVRIESQEKTCNNW